MSGYIIPAFLAPFQRMSLKDLQSIHQKNGLDAPLIPTWEEFKRQHPDAVRASDANWWANYHIVAGPGQGTSGGSDENYDLAGVTKNSDLSKVQSWKGRSTSVIVDEGDGPELENAFYDVVVNRPLLPHESMEILDRTLHDLRKNNRHRHRNKN